jgi:hypothetical protein
MGLLIGPTPWWQSLIFSSVPVGTTLPDGSRLICKAGGTAWIVAPSSTEVVQVWNNSSGSVVGNKCCASDWSTLCTCLISRSFNPSDWFVPSIAQLQNPGYVCRTQWDTYKTQDYWSSTEINATDACAQRFTHGGLLTKNKSVANPGPTPMNVRAFRCVTY